MLQIFLLFFLLHFFSDKGEKKIQHKSNIQLRSGNDMLEMAVQLLIGIQQTQRLFLSITTNSLTHTHTALLVTCILISPA